MKTVTLSTGESFNTDGLTHVIIEATHGLTGSRPIGGKHFFVQAFRSLEDARVKMCQWAVEESDNHTYDDEGGATDQDGNIIYGAGEDRYNYDGHCYTIYSVDELDEVFTVTQIYHICNHSGMIFNHIEQEQAK